MPTPPSVPNVCRFRLIGVLANAAPWGIRIYSAYTGGTPGPTDMLTFAEGVASAWNTWCTPIVTSDTTLTTVEGTDMSSDLGAQATADVTYSGSDGGTPVQNATAAVVKGIISRRYRGGKPKNFLPGISTSGLADESHLTSGYASTIGTAWQNWWTAIGALTSSGVALSGPVNVSFYKGFTSHQDPFTLRWRNVPTYRSAALVDVIESFTVDELLGVQKRRRVG